MPASLGPTVRGSMMPNPKAGAGCSNHARTLRETRGAAARPGSVVASALAGGASLRFIQRSAPRAVGTRGLLTCSQRRLAAAAAAVDNTAHSGPAGFLRGTVAGSRGVCVASASLSGPLCGLLAVQRCGIKYATSCGGSCSSSSGASGQRRYHDLARSVVPVTACMPTGASELPSTGAPAFAGGSRRRKGRRSAKPDSPAPAPAAAGGPANGSGGSTSIASGPAPSAASSPVPPPNPGAGGSSAGGAISSGKGVVAAASRSAAASSGASAAVAVAERSLDGSDSDYEGTAGSSNAMAGNIVPFARRQPRALVLDCAYRPINVLTWYRAFHFDYFGRGEVLEYYPPPAVCTTGAGEHPLPAVIRVPSYTADMQDLCSRVACTRRNIMVRDGFCCQYCGSRRDLTLDHVHPVSKGGKETWENLVTACMRCNQKKSDRTLRELGWKLRRQPKEPTPYEIGIVAGIATSDILRPPPEWEAYIAPYRERLEMYRRAAVEAGLVNLMEDD